MVEAVTLRQVWAGYETTPVLEDITLSVKEQDFLGLIGPNGGGKTTLLKVLLGLIRPTQGKVEILGFPVAQGRKYLGYVPQLLEFDRNFPIRVRDVVQMGRLGKRRLLQPYTSQDAKIVRQSLERVGMLALSDRKISELSGGERQRVYLARALASEPQILLLDEPTANIDAKGKTSIYELLKELNQSLTIILISHDLGAISSYVKTVGCLNRHLFYHNDKLITPEMIEQTYQCPVDLIAHGVPHRVFPPHSSSKQSHD